MKNKIVGTGITKRKVVVWDDFEEALACLKQGYDSMVGRRYDFEDWILKPIEETAWNTLQAAGLTRKKLLQEAKRIAERAIDNDDDFFAILGATNLTKSKEDSPEGFAARWLMKIWEMRLYRESDPDRALRHAFYLGHSVGIAELKRNWEGLALHGKRFREGPQQPRNDALSNLLASMLPASNRTVLNRLQPGKIIQEIDRDDGIVWWITEKGAEKKTTYKSIKNRLASLRKKASAKKSTR